MSSKQKNVVRISTEDNRSLGENILEDMQDVIKKMQDANGTIIVVTTRVHEDDLPSILVKKYR